MNHCLKWGTHFDLANKRDRVEELEHTMEEPGFWDDPNKSAAVVQDCKKLKTTIERYEKLCNDKDDTLTLIDIAEEENDAVFCLRWRSRLMPLRKNIMHSG